MLKRGEPTNIPIELLRTVVAIVEAGGFTKAARRLNISQPAVSAQIKRLQILIGGEVFDRSAPGLALTERGVTLLPLAKRILEANDHILRVGGSAGDSAPIRIGADALYARRIAGAFAGRTADGAAVLCDAPEAIAKGLRDGYLDIACVLDPPAGGPRAASWSEELVWVRARDFVWSPGSPLPIVGLPGQPQDKIAVDALQRTGLAYRHAFVAADPTARLAAVASGIGIIALTERCPRGDLVVAKEYYLPPLGPVEAGICLRPGLDRRRVDALLARLVTALAPASREPSNQARPKTWRAPMLAT